LEVGRDIPAPYEISALLTALNQPKFTGWRPLLMTAIFTGLRASELRGLRWSDVDLENGHLHVRQRIDRFGAVGAPKSNSSTRTLPLPPIVVNVLRQWKLASKFSQPGDLVFCNGVGKHENHGNVVRRGLHPAWVAAGVTDQHGAPKYSGMHCLRHFFASWCINRRVDGGLELPIKTVQSYMGHSSILVTADTYGHLFPAQAADEGFAAAAARLASRAD
jgi:integrase